LLLEKKEQKLLLLCANDFVYTFILLSILLL
jgi:hypothetical protein